MTIAVGITPTRKEALITESNRLFELADKLKALRDQKQETEQLLKDINEKIDETDYQLSELMAENEMQNFSRSGTMFYLTTTTRASTVAGSKDKLYAALRSKGYGDLVYETVNANSLSSFIKERMGENEDKLPGWLIGIVNVYDKTTVGVKKAKK
jgi:hypothetical protein